MHSLPCPKSLKFFILKPSLLKGGGDRLRWEDFGRGTACGGGILRGERIENGWIHTKRKHNTKLSEYAKNFVKI